MNRTKIVNDRPLLQSKICLSSAYVVEPHHLPRWMDLASCNPALPQFDRSKGQATKHPGPESGLLPLHASVAPLRLAED